MANTTGKKFGGRKHGTPNKTTKRIREVLIKIVENQLQEIEALIEQLEGKEKADFIVKILPFVIPKIQEKTLPEDNKKIIRIGFSSDPK